MKVALITPPMTQINTPYPATAYLTGFLEKMGYKVTQRDFSIEVFRGLFNSAGMQRIEKAIRDKSCGTHTPLAKSVRHFLYNAQRYQQTIDSVVTFLEGRNPTLAYRLVGDDFLPRGGRFKSALLLSETEGLQWAFGTMGVQDQAKYFATLYIDEIADAIREGVDESFELSRYGERLAASATTFDLLKQKLDDTPSIIDDEIDRLTVQLVRNEKPEIVGLSVPFPGNVYGAFRIAKAIKEIDPKIAVVLGGGYVNTELRELSDPRVFDYVDFVTFDDGEAPLKAIIDTLQSKASISKNSPLLRTLIRSNGKVAWVNDKTLSDPPFRNSVCPTYRGLNLDVYVSMSEVLNPMHRLWSDGRWNKLIVAHGCYWKKCTFCDVSLDYIKRYEPDSASAVVDKMEQLIEETGQTGFHFVDEAAPPALLGQIADEIIRRKMNVSWWGNIRFESAFTEELVSRLAASGCIAITGGLEVASDRLLALMQKGVSVKQVAQVTKAFANAGVMVHAYLMFGFPSETLQETIDSLERVRQLFLAGCIHSAFWHRFSVTVHSPIGRSPEKYGITLNKPDSTFAQNDIPFTDAVDTDHDSLHFGLKKAVYNFMHGIGLEDDVRDWFEFTVPKAKVPKTLIHSEGKYGLQN